MFADYQSEVPLDITFFHGDGAAESGADEQSGFYNSPDTYTVTASWRTVTGSQSGAYECGRIRVIAPITPDPITTDPITPEPITPEPITPDPITPTPRCSDT